jgi:MFS-type transporter involved in bile tolerance (Atg22 family)
MARFIKSDEQEETWGVFNSIQGFGSMIGPLSWILLKTPQVSSCSSDLINRAIKVFHAGNKMPYIRQEETWGVFNSIQGFGSMIGPLFGGLITQFTNNLNNTFYFSALIHLI